MQKKHVILTIIFALATSLFLMAFQFQYYTIQTNRLWNWDTARFGNTSHGATTVYPIANLASATTLTIPVGSTFALTGTANCTRIIAGTPGRRVMLIAASTDTFTDGVNLKLAGNFNGTADDILQLVAQDTFWVEVSRSVN